MPSVQEWTNERTEWIKIKFNVSADSALESPMHMQVVNDDGEKQNEYKKKWYTKLHTKI